MTELSAESRAVLGGVFGFGQVLTYHMVENVPSPEMQAALDELLEAKMITREQGLPEMTRMAIRYRAVEGLDLVPFKREVLENIENGTGPSIRVFIKRAGAA